MPVMLLLAWFGSGEGDEESGKVCGAALALFSKV